MYVATHAKVGNLNGHIFSNKTVSKGNHETIGGQDGEIRSDDDVLVSGFPIENGALQIDYVSKESHPLPGSQVAVDEALGAEECHSACDIITHAGHFMRKNLKRAVGCRLGLCQEFFK